MLITLQLNLPPAVTEETGAGAQAASTPPPTADSGASRALGAKILRFAKSERMVHWSIAGPFLVSYFSALILVVVYNPDRFRPFRIVFAVLHRVSGVALTVLPMLATYKSRGDARIHLYNIKQAWTWMFEDIQWLALMMLAAMNSKIELPEQGKFNAAEKVNFMVLMVCYPLYVATGLLMWITNLAIFSWLLHVTMALFATPLLLGHLFMALVNPGSRKGLPGMISGWVDRHWAKHHYRRWYREHHESTEAPQEETGGGPGASAAPIKELPAIPMPAPGTTAPETETWFAKNGAGRDRRLASVPEATGD